MLLYLMLSRSGKKRLDCNRGRTEQGNHWVGCGGHYSGTFIAPWLDIPATGHLAHMRFHEFFRFEEGKIVEIQALWDIPELMMQANAWPMAPSLGLEYHVPGPGDARWTS